MSNNQQSEAFQLLGKLLLAGHGPARSSFLALFILICKASRQAIILHQLDAVIDLFHRHL